MTKSNSNNESNLARWLADPRSDKYFGRRFAFKFAVLAVVVSGTGTLADVARRYAVSRQAASKHAAAVRHIFDIPKH